LQKIKSISDSPDLIAAIRGRFAHVDSCPYGGPRVYFENGGGALTLKSVIETSAHFAGVPDNQGRDNAAAKALEDVIVKAKADLAVFMNAQAGQFIAGETGTELLYRMIRTACINAPKGSKIIGSSIEHPSSRSAAQHWAKTLGMAYVNVPHEAQSGTVTVDDYAALMTPDVAVATILQASPVTGIGIDVVAISNAIRVVAPECLIIVDGIQHAAHGQLDLSAYNVDGYAISPYKVFSRHGYGIAWISDRMAALPHEALHGGPALNWELGTRDAGAYAAISDVIAYFDWLGGEVSQETDFRRRIEAAGQAVHDYEADLTNALIRGTDGQRGLRDMDRVTILSGAENPARVGTVSFAVQGMASPEIAAQLSEKGIRTHTRKADHYSGNILFPLNLTDCLRISMCHYNTTQEVSQTLRALNDISGLSKKGRAMGSEEVS
tara:strand:+ start:3885 stop:5195 length:1311 start_codon:yes stop_codon:yes gene_type:complete